MPDPFDCPTTTPTSNFCRPQDRPRSLIWACTLACAFLPAPSVAEEAPAEIIAAHIRQQGYACEKALGAQRNREESKPDEPDWILRCNNASYRVRLIPDMAAQVETIKQ